MRLVRLLFCLVFMVTLTHAVPMLPAEVQAETRAASAVTLPAGFVDEPFVSGLLSPRTFAWTPDGRLLVVERGSATSLDSNLASIRVVQSGVMLPARAYTREVCGGGERGLLGLAVDRNFAANGFLYICYSALDTSGASSPCRTGTYVANQPGPRNTISRLTMTGNTIDPASEVVLINNIATDTGIHNAGDLAIDADNYLYASVGDSNILPNNLAQDLSSLNGKILRIKPQPNGSYTTDGNPYDADPNGFTCGQARPPNPIARCREIFASGFRNPFRMTLKPDNTGVFVGDVGGGAWEEISEITSGNNAGFNLREGPCPAGVVCPQPAPPSGYTDPIYAYPHNTLNSADDAAIIAGAFYTGTTGGTPWPSDYVGDYFFSDNVRGFIRRLKFNAASQTWNAITPEFGEEALGRSIIGLRTGPDGNLYYLTYISDESRDSEIRRIRYQAAGNVAPEARASVSPANGSLSTPFVFSAAGSTDPDNSLPLQYHWDFGDGSAAQTTSNLTITHQYSLAGTQLISLTVIDSGTPPRSSPVANVSVFVGNTPPTATIILTNTTQPGRALFHGDDVWEYGALNPTDDTPLPSDAFLWSVVFHHRDHTHPFLPNLSGQTGEFTIPSTGEVDPVVWYRVTLFLKDAVGQVSTLIRDVYPQTTTLSFNTHPADGQVTVDGVVRITPITITRVIGMNSVIDVPSPQTTGSQNYAFQSWTHGGAQLQQVIAPVTGASYTANLRLIPAETSTATHTATATQTPTASPTATSPNASTSTATAVATPTSTPTPTATSLSASTSTVTAVATPTQTPTPTALPPNGATATATATPTQTPLSLPPNTATATATPTQTPTSTLPNAATATVTAVSTQPPVSTALFTATSTVRATATPTQFATVAETTPTPVQTQTAQTAQTATSTPQLSVTSTATSTPTQIVISITPSPARATATEVVTPISTPFMPNRYYAPMLLH